MKSSFDQWPIWKRVVYTNAIAIAGVCIGFAFSDAKLSVRLHAFIAVFSIAFLNFMFLVVQPRIKGQITAGSAIPKVWRVFYQALAERPFVSLLIILQLSGVARGTATTIVFIQTSVGDYVLEIPNAQAMVRRLIVAAVLMAVVTVLWLLGAIGLWQSRSWGWWLALALNGLAATVTVVLQFWKPNKFWVDPLAVAAVVLLLTPSVRTTRGKSFAVET